MKPILQTRLIGMTQHKSGHILAPPDLVYQVEEKPRQRTTLWQKVLGLGVLAACVYAAVQSLVFIATGIVIGV